MSSARRYAEPIVRAEDPALESLRYPIGLFTASPPYSPAQIATNLERLELLPGHLRATVETLTSAQLETAYRPGGWTVRQVVHHLPDSHSNAYTRFRLALTEDEPTIRPYAEARWAELPDAARGPIELSLELLEAVHRRWLALLRALRPEQWERRYFHPEMQQHFRLDTALALYAWHGEHHLAHVQTLSRREGWTR